MGEQTNNYDTPTYNLEDVLKVLGKQEIYIQVVLGDGVSGKMSLEENFSELLMVGNIYQVWMG